MTGASEGADGPVARVALGVRLELFDETGTLFGALVREDVKGAAVPRAGEYIAAGTLSQELHQLVGLSPQVHHVDHYVQVPGSRDWDPLCMVISHIAGVDADEIQASQEFLEAQGWGVMLFNAAYPQLSKTR